MGEYKGNSFYSTSTFNPYCTGLFWAPTDWGGGGGGGPPPPPMISAVDC